ncbi:MAG: DUF2207 domain-containing protein, partial [Candidatus Cloacimonetes bacterium]|nr:DUF2207 domain-containing protein [Candidatus Cloacimonadota bacterium]
IVKTVRKNKLNQYYSLDIPGDIHPVLLWKLIFSPVSKSYNFGGSVLNLIWKGALLIDGKTSAILSKDYDWHFNESFVPDNEIDRKLLEELHKLTEKKYKPLIATAKQLLSLNKNPLGKQLHASFLESGLCDEAKTKKMVRNVTLSTVVMVFSIILFVPAFIAWNIGIGYAFIPVMVIIVFSFILIFIFGTQEYLSVEGESEKRTWLGFKKFYLENLKTKNVITDADYIKKVFPYLIIFGIEKKFLKYCETNNIALPDYMQELNFNSWHDFSSFNAAFIAVIATSGSGATGAGGAGAAGGGSAGAS